MTRVAPVTRVALITRVAPVYKCLSAPDTRVAPIIRVASITRVDPITRVRLSRGIYTKQKKWAKTVNPLQKQTQLELQRPKRYTRGPKQTQLVRSCTKTI